jgi:hypothetical protein
MITLIVSGSYSLAPRKSIGRVQWRSGESMRRPNGRQVFHAIIVGGLADYSATLCQSKRSAPLSTRVP